MEDEYDDCAYDDDVEESDEDETSETDDEEDIADNLSTGSPVSDPILEEYIGLPYLTKFEKTRILGTRASQIALGAEPFVHCEDNTDPYEIALQELLEKKMPLYIRRTFGKKHVDIDVNTLDVLM